MLGILVLILVFLMFFNLYPFWMQQAIWQAMCYYALSYFGIGALRILLLTIAYHFGVTFWLFPNYRKSYYPQKFMLPVASFEVREDAMEPKMLLFRLTSVCIFAYTLV
jgi:hypothetical protein